MQAFFIMFLHFFRINFFRPVDKQEKIGYTVRNPYFEEKKICSFQGIGGADKSAFAETVCFADAFSRTQNISEE